MELYNLNNNKVIFDNLGNWCGTGMYGSVYKINDDECIKIFKTLTNNRSNIEVLKYLKNLGLKNFYKINDIYYDEDGNFRAYSMKYYSKGDIDILTMPVEYTLDNLYNIYKSINILSNNNIFANDLSNQNVILDKNDITIIDADCYNFENNVTSKNIHNLKRLFCELYREAIRKYHPDMLKNYDIYYENIYRLFNYGKNIDINDFNNTCYKLVKHKYPIDLIKKKCKY